MSYMGCSVVPKCSEFWEFITHSDPHIIGFGIELLSVCFHKSWF